MEAGASSQVRDVGCIGQIEHLEAVSGLTKGDLKKLLQAVPEDGWLGGRRIYQHFNPCLVSMEDRMWGDLGNHDKGCGQKQRGNEEHDQ